MSSTIIVVLLTIGLLFIVLLLIFFLRQGTSLRLEGDSLVVKSLFRTEHIDLSQELENWKVQKAHYLRWGEFYSINMLFKQGNRKAVGSLFNRESYSVLYHHLNSHFKNKQVAD